MLIQITDPSLQETPTNHETDLAIGIDLGTTHSVIAISKNHEARTLANTAGETLIPSVVAYTDQGIVTGRNALPYPQAIKSIKRRMGQSTNATSPSPIEVSAEILKALKAQAEESLGATIRRAVITVPAYFDEGARQETKQAAELAGIQVLRLINEPTAAALAYGLDQGVEGTYAVYDLGGGTFDISLIRFTKGVFQVMATAGDTQLGGDDIDTAILKHVRQTSPQAPDSLSRALKEALSTQTSVTLNGVTLSRDQLHTLTQPFLKRTFDICANALKDASLSPKDLQGIILVGGSTKMPFVQESVEAYFGQKPLTNLNPDEVVALGAALQAEALTHGSDTLLLDVTPLSLGLETMGGIVEKIIHRNTPIPAAISQIFTTYQDGQTAMKIHVVQGEREFVKDCRSLAEFTLSGIPPMLASIARIQITFRLDVDGLLNVSAQELTTGVEQKVDINATYGLSHGDLLTMLRDSYAHGHEDIEERLLVESRVHSEQFLSMLETAIAEDRDLLEGDEETNIKNNILLLKNILKSSDKNAIKTQLENLERLSHGFAERRINRSIHRALAGTSVK